MVASPVVLVLALVGLGVLVKRIQELWKTRGESSKQVRRQRIRFGVLSLSLLGLVAVFGVQALHLPVWFVDVGMVLIFGSWGAYIVLSIVFGFLEGLSE